MASAAETVLATLPKELQHNPVRVMDYARQIGVVCLGLKETSVKRERGTIEFLDGSRLRPSGKQDGRLPGTVWVAVSIDRRRPRIEPEVLERRGRIKQGET